MRDAKTILERIVNDVNIVKINVYSSSTSERSLLMRCRSQLKTKSIQSMHCLFFIRCEVHFERKYSIVIYRSVDLIVGEENDVVILTSSRKKTRGLFLTLFEILVGAGWWRSAGVRAVVKDVAFSLVVEFDITVDVGKVSVREETADFDCICVSLRSNRIWVLLMLLLWWLVLSVIGFVSAGVGPDRIRSGRELFHDGQRSLVKASRNARDIRQ